MMDKKLYKEVVVYDISDEILKYCVEVPKQGIRCSMNSTIMQTPLDCDYRLIDPTRYDFSYKSYGRLNENTFDNDSSFVWFITMDGRNFLAKGRWILPYLKSVGYVQGNYANPVFKVNSAYMFADPEVSNALYSVPNVDPFMVLSNQESEMSL